MNDQRREGICWCDWTWTPIWGCDGPEGNGRPCDYCYAYRLRGRVGATLDCDDCREFTPHLHAERLMGDKAPAAVRTPGVVFADSMGDWWGPRVNEHWRTLALDAMRRAPWHSYVVLTKRPDLICWADLLQLAELAPESFWLGGSGTGMHDIWRVEKQLVDIMRALPPGGREKIRAVVSVEPLLRTAGGWDPFQRGWPEIDWVICGALTGPGGEQPTWGDRVSLRDWAERCGAAMWEKDNLSGQRTQTRPVPMLEHLGA